MIVLLERLFIGEAQGAVDDHFVIRLVCPIPSDALCGPDLHGGEGILPDVFLYIVLNAVFIAVGKGLRRALALVLEDKFHPCVDDGLALERLLKIFERDIDIRKNGDVRLPADSGAGVLAGIGDLFHFANGLALFKMQFIAEAVAVDLRIHILGGVLRSTQAQAVQPEGELIHPGGIVCIVLAAGVELAEDELPVVFLFILVVIHGYTAPPVAHLDGGV